MPSVVERPPDAAIASLVEADAYAAQQAAEALRAMNTLNEVQQAVRAALHGAWTDFRVLIAAAVEREREDAMRWAEEERADV